VGKKLGDKKTGRRQKGIPNRKTVEMHQKCQELGVDPFEVLCFYASRNWKKLGYQSATVTKVLKDGGVIEVDRITSDQQIECAKELCQYLYAKKRSVDITAGEGEEGQGFKIVIQDYSKKDAGT
jgi:hypothetical protein